MMAAPCTPARQCFVPKHKVVLQCDVLWQDAKGVHRSLAPPILGLKPWAVLLTISWLASIAGF